MRVVRLDGKRVGYALVDGERVVQLDLDEDWASDLQRGEHEMTIELDPTFETDPETNEMKYAVTYLSSKFTW